MDALSDVLRVAHLTGGVFMHAVFSAPWCMAARIAPEHCRPAIGQASHLIPYHYVIEGEVHIRVEGDDGEELVIGAGDVVLLPRNNLHLMGSDLSLAPVPGNDIIQLPSEGGLFSIDHGGGGARTRMICGFLGYESSDDNPMISTLPSLLKLKAELGGAAEWIRSTFQYAAEEVAVGRPGSETVLAKLSELLFVEAVRRYAEALPEGQTGLPGCAIPTLPGRWRCYTAILDERGTWMSSVVRSVCRARHLPSVSFASLACRPCIISIPGECRWRI
jgi:hypothetical protein